MAAQDLHALAVDAEHANEQLATALGEAGADENAVKAVTQCADVTRQIVRALGKGQERSGDAESPDAPPPEDKQPATIGEATDQMVAAHRAAQPPQ